MGTSDQDERTIIENIQDGYCEIDLQGTFTHVNMAACEIFGYSRDEIIGINHREYANKANAQRAYKVFNQIYRTGIPGRLFDYELTRKDGTRRLLEVFASLIIDRSGKAVGFRGTARDVTERRQMEEELRRSEERYRTIIEEMEDAYFELDLRGKFTFVNDASCRFLGYPREELIGMSNRRYARTKTIREMHKLFSGVYKTGEPVKAHAFELFPKHGEVKHSEISISLIMNKQGEPVGFRGIARDITARKESEAQIRHLATHDILTGLPNRIMFSELLEQDIKMAHRYGRQFALLFMDLDGFKIINDTFGHETGDKMLVICAARLRRMLRASDFIARLGGDEFVIIVRNVTSRNNLITLVRKVLSTVREPVYLRGKEFFFTASIGISIYPQDGRDKKSLMRTADIAMYSAKEKGSNNYQFFSLGIRSQLHERDKYEQQLAHALERNEIFLEYQPKLDLKTGVITGVEALVRWRNRSLGLVAPMKLLPVAESTGLIISIGQWILKTACMQNAAWQRCGLPRIGMAVNLSQRQLMDEGLIKGVETALSESGLEPGLLELEITGSLLISYFSRIVEVLSRLRDLGVRLALDDFGAGYSSLAQIRHLPVDTLKIDRSVTRNIPENKIDIAFARAITGIGKALDLTVVVEGVETAEQLAFFQDIPCDMAQGFYFSRPLSPGRVAELLAQGGRIGTGTERTVTPVPLQNLSEGR